MTELRDKVHWRSDECKGDDLPNSFSVCPGRTLQHMHASRGTCIVRARSGDNVKGLYICSKCVRFQKTKNEPQLDHGMAIKATSWPIALGKRTDDNRIIEAVRIGGGRRDRTKGLRRL